MSKNAVRQFTCKAMQSVKFVQTNDGQVSAFRSTFKDCNAALQAGYISQKTLNLGPELVNALMQCRVGFQHILCKAAQGDMQKPLANRDCGAVGHGKRVEVCCALQCKALKTRKQ